MRIIIVAGKFDPFHAGHLSHIQKAGELGDYILVITHKDDIVAKSSKKQICFNPYPLRKLILEGILHALHLHGEVLCAIDDDKTGDGTVALELELIANEMKSHELIFTKGGDRKDNSCMPQNELDACLKNGIEIRYGVGDLLGSSSDIVRRLLS